MIDNIFSFVFFLLLLFFLSSSCLYFSSVSFPLLLFFLPLYSYYRTVPICQLSVWHFLDWNLHNSFWWIVEFLSHKFVCWFQDWYRFEGLPLAGSESGCGGTDPPPMNKFLIIGDSAGCAVVCVNPHSVNVHKAIRGLQGVLCSVKNAPSEFLHNIPQQSRQLSNSHETALGSVPVIELVWFGDWFHPIPYDPEVHTTDTMIFLVFYQSPYGDCEWRTQEFSTLEEAERMKTFYLSCGSSAKVQSVELTYS